MLEELQRVSAEPLRAARQEAERLGLEAEAGRAEVQRLQEALQRGEGAAQESQGLRARARQLTKELEELRGQHRQTGARQLPAPPNGDTDPSIHR